MVQNWPKPKFICNIQVFISFANFYRRFIQGFSKIAGLFTSILKTIQLFRLATTMFDTKDEAVGGGGRADKRVVNLSKSKKLKNNKF